MNTEAIKEVLEGYANTFDGVSAVELVDDAAAELAAMQARIEKLEAVRKAAQSHMDFHGKPKGISKTNDDLLDALAECDK